MWRERIKYLQRSQDYYTSFQTNYKKTKTPKHRKKDYEKSVSNVIHKNEIKKYDEFDDEDEYSEDSIFSSPLQQPPMVNKGDLSFNQSYFEKYTRDKIRVLRFLKNQGGIEEIKRVRFLFISVQTFGNVDGVCMPAEIAMCEFNLKHGIIDQFNSTVGPWEMVNDIQRRRARFHSNETHKIPLESIGGKTTKMSTQGLCLREILGRCEPNIARQQGVAVGLYRSDDFDFEKTNIKTANIQDETSEDINAGDPNGRRWLICLKHEYELIRASLEYLKDSQHLCYEGFPDKQERFIFADTLVDGLAEYVGRTPNEEYKLWLDIFGKTQPFEFSTPWERYSDVFCRTHSGTRNCHCAAATVARSCFAIFFALQEQYSLPFGD